MGRNSRHALLQKRNTLYFNVSMTLIGKNLALLSLIITFCLLSSNIKNRNHAPIDIFEN